ncbi:MAE_28990/MAE_18760 family HEPN-like nuclease [Asaia sp. HN010]|uniref:MAE_28990/MAE_18760 family HEPN-like nuclease n=1 Tax=Asaia sp. HN010 TaxID=3081233 RepID=UPI00301858F3
MELPSEGLEERLREIDSYLDFLKSIEEAARSGPPRLQGASNTITAEQQRILYSSVFLQLYSVVEATITRCLNYVTVSMLESRQPKPCELDERLRRVWVQEVARTHVDLTPEHRLESVLELCDRLIGALPMAPFAITKGAGNWDDKEIEAITYRLGCKLSVPTEVYKAARRPFRNEKNALGYIKYLRNKLAHGEISFAQCSEDITVEDLSRLTLLTSDYLKGVTASFEAYIDTEAYLAGAAV